MDRILTDEQAARVEQFELDCEKVEALLQLAGREVNQGLLPAAQLAIAREGEVVLKQSFGSAQDDSLICVFSATKAITSAAAWLLFQQGCWREHKLGAGSGGTKRAGCRARTVAARNYGGNQSM